MLLPQLASRGCVVHTLSRQARALRFPNEADLSLRDSVESTKLEKAVPQFFAKGSADSSAREKVLKAVKMGVSAGPTEVRWPDAGGSSRKEKEQGGEKPQGGFAAVFHNLKPEEKSLQETAKQLNAEVETSGVVANPPLGKAGDSAPQVSSANLALSTLKAMHASKPNKGANKESPERNPTERPAATNGNNNNNSNTTSSTTSNNHSHNNSKNTTSSITTSNNTNNTNNNNSSSSSNTSGLSEAFLQTQQAMEKKVRDLEKKLQLLSARVAPSPAVPLPSALHYEIMKDEAIPEVDFAVESVPTREIIGSINKVDLAGVVGRPSVKLWQTGIVCEFTLTTSFSRADVHGSDTIIEKETHKIYAHGKTLATFIMSSVKQGYQVHVSGRLSCYSKWSEEEATVTPSYAVHVHPTSAGMVTILRGLVEDRDKEFNSLEYSRVSGSDGPRGEHSKDKSKKSKTK